MTSMAIVDSRYSASDCVCDLFPPLPTDVLDDTLDNTRFTRCLAIPSGKARWGESPRTQKEFKALKCENIFFHGVTDTGLAALTSLTPLQSLSVGRTEITDATGVRKSASIGRFSHGGLTRARRVMASVGGPLTISFTGITTMRHVITLVLLGTVCAAAAQEDEISVLRTIVRDSTDVAIQSEAIEKLKRLGRQALPALRELLAHPEPTVRALVLSALGNLGSRQREPQSHAAWVAAPDMIRLLEDPDIRVRRAAAYNLGLFWDPPGEGPKRDEVAKSAVPKLASCLSDEDHRLREYSARLLWKIADVAWEAVPALVAVLEDKESAARDARRTLLFLGPPERAYTARQLRMVLEAQPAAPDISGASNRWAGYHDLEARADLGLSRLEALLYLGRKATDPEARAAGSLLSRLAADDHPAVRFHALAARARLDLAEESPIPTLDAALSGDDPSVAFWAAHALVELLGAEAHRAVGILAGAIPEYEPRFTPLGPTPDQRLAMVKARFATESLQRSGIRVPREVRAMP